MAKWGKADFEELRRLQERLQRLEDIDLDQFCTKVSKELAARLLAYVIPRTPVLEKPKFEGDETVSVMGASGETGTFLTAEGARMQQYWSGYSGGTLRRGWTAKTHDEAENGSDQPSAVQVKEYAQSLPVSKIGREFIVEVINPVEYASYVEFGHRQTPGRYVPAIGKRLKESWVDGKYFLTFSEDELRQKAPAVIQKKLDKLLREALNG